jgi:uncharacterized protein
MEELRVERDGASLAVSYSPAGEAAVVAVHGAGVGTRDWYLYRHLHELLPLAGIGVATFDRRGDGDSTGEPSRGNFTLQADDAITVGEALGVPEFGIWGISQGGWVGPVAATRSDRVAFLVLLASCGVSPAEQMRFATAEQLRRAGYGDEVVTRALALRERAESWIRAERVAGLDRELAAAADEPWWRHVFLPPSLPPEAEADAVRRALADELFFEPEPVFAQVRVPTLLFYGDQDEWIPVEPSIAAWRRARGDEVEIVVIPGTGHEPTVEDEEVVPEYERALVAWLTERASPARR